jgi:hypothetical protein
MPFRNPVYLDSELLSNLADYFGIALPVETNVIRRSLQEGGKGIGVNKVVQANAENSHAEEVTETFSVSTRPVRLMNDLIDHVESTSDVIDLDADPQATLGNRALVQISGDLIPAAANEIGTIMSRFLPLLISQVSAGATEFNPSPTELMGIFMADSDQVSAQLFEFEPSEPVEGRRCLVIIDPKMLHGSATLEDLEGEQTLVAHVDKMVRPGAELSLEKYLLPGLPRAVRRAMGPDTLMGMVSGLDDVIGRKIDPNELIVTGPALILRPLAAS